MVYAPWALVVAEAILAAPTVVGKRSTSAPAPIGTEVPPGPGVRTWPVMVLASTLIFSVRVGGAVPGV